jgi:Zn-finger nucleic acid-binding protein
MVIYEVNLTINPEISGEFLDWLNNEHLSEMMSHEGFYQQKVFYRKPEEEGLNEEKRLITIHYYVHSRKDLETYLSQHSQKMRQKALDKYGGQFSAERRVLYRD